MTSPIPTNPNFLGPEGEPWRGDVHLEDWPVEFAGPEYQMHKSVADAIEALLEDCSIRH